ncbi:head-tail connector protein [Wolbachia pipientis]|uniref:head-tail connector protein n=1 Tax=Wolbachia pipientis TaxID=955 RepID=UPI0025A46EBC|nr:head-tail connector protein [Wolbachia pipientis]
MAKNIFIHGTNKEGYMSASPRIYVQRKPKPKFFPVTLEEVKSFLRVENDQDDRLISNLIFM